MKFINLIFALLFTSSVAAQEIPKEIMALINGINKAQQELALCQAYHIHFNNVDKRKKFEQHSDTLITVTMDFFSEYTGVAPSYFELMDVYNRNVDISLNAIKDGTTEQVAPLSELGEACDDLSLHHDKANELLNQL